MNTQSVNGLCLTICLVLNCSQTKRVSFYQCDTVTTACGTGMEMWMTLWRRERSGWGWEKIHGDGVGIMYFTVSLCVR